MRISDWSSDVCPSDLRQLLLIPISTLDQRADRMTAKPCLRHLRPSRKPIESGIFIFGQINGDPVFRRHKLPHFAAKCSTLHLYASGSTLSQFQVCSLFVLIKSLQMQCFLEVNLIQMTSL